MTQHRLCLGIESAPCGIHHFVGTGHGGRQRVACTAFQGIIEGGEGGFVGGYHRLVGLYGEQGGFGLDAFLETEVFFGTKFLDIEVFNLCHNFLFLMVVFLMLF